MKQVIQQKNGIMIYSDGTEETIEEYREKNPQPAKDHGPKYNPEEQADRDRIIEKIYQYDKSTGMHYEPGTGFIRSNGRYVTTIEAAKETFSGTPTRELKEIEKAILREEGHAHN